MMQESARDVRRARKIETLGFDAACRHCGETEILCLHEVAVDGTPIILCANCRAAFQGRKPVESHHVLGRHNGNLTVSIPPNDHAILSDYQYDWPKDTLRNPTGSPLRIIAALLRGWIDLLGLVMAHVKQWITFLENLDTYLTGKLGPQWWTEVRTMEKSS